MRTELKGATSRIWEIFIPDSSSTTGAGLTGLVFNSASLSAYYHRESAASATAITLATMTVGTFTSSGFKEIDATNMPGWYQFCPPNAALATGAEEVSFHLKGATNMAPVPIVCKLNDQPKIQSNTKVGQALANFMFVMTDSSGNAVLGATVVPTRSIDGAAFVSCTNAVTEVANGWYKINLSTTDMNGNVIALRFAATGARDTDQVLINLP